MVDNGKIGRPQKYLFQKDFDAFIVKEWNIFRYNDWIHLKRDVSWIKYLLLGLIGTIIATAITVICNAP